MQRRELVVGGALGLLQPRAQRLRFGRRLGLGRRQPLAHRRRLGRRAAGALLGVGEPVAQVVGVGLQRLLGALGVGLGGAQRGLQRQRLRRPRCLGLLQLRSQRLGLARRRVAILGRRRQPPAQRSGLLGARPRLGQLGLHARQARGRLLGQRRALAGGGRRRAQLLQLGARRLRARLGLAPRGVLGVDAPARLAQLGGEQRRPLGGLVGALARRLLGLGLGCPPRRALLAHARGEVVGAACRGLGALGERLGLGQLLLERLDALLGLLGAPLRGPGAQQRLGALVLDRLGALAQLRQLGGARLGDLPRLVDRGQPRLGGTGGAARALGDLLGGGDLALALLQRAARLVGDLDRLARLLGGPRRALAVLAGALLLGGGALAGAHALFGEGVDGAGAGGLGVGGEIGDPRGLVGRLLGDRMRLGRPALGVLAGGALLGQPRVQRGDVGRARELADVERRRWLLGRAHEPSQPADATAALGFLGGTAAARPRPLAAAPPAPAARRAPSAAADP